MEGNGGPSKGGGLSACESGGFDCAPKGRRLCRACGPRQAAMTNFRFMANAVMSTEEVKKALGGM